ncbi:MAG TPA: hypothetical protein VHO91_02720 [Rhodopila sp.]|nr:hypothetical protein [Rhodopila sp.]
MPLVEALRQHGDAYSIWLRRHPVVSGPGDTDPAQEMNVAGLVRFMRALPRDNRINIYLNSTNTYFPGLSLALQRLAPPGIWVFDIHDDLRYHNLGLKRLREQAIISTLYRTSDAAVHAAPILQELFPHSRHLGNASHLRPLDHRDAGWDDVLVIASFDERFDFDFLSRLAELSQDLRFHLHGWTRKTDDATAGRIRDLVARHDNVLYHGPYATEDLRAVLSRYRMTVAPYLAEAAITRYIDPLRFYHCLNAGLEVVSTAIPQARYMERCVHVVPDPVACRQTLLGLRAGQNLKQPGYTPITWEQRADRLIEIVSALPRTATLRRQRSAG